MKKYLSLLLVVAMILALTACGGAPAEDPTETRVETVSTTEETVPTDATEEPTEEATEPVLRSPLGLENPENTDTSSKENVEIPSDAELISMASDTLSPDPIRANLADPVDPNRPNYDVGSCRQLEGDVFFLCIFVDDATSSWTEWEVSNFFDQKIYPGLNFLQQQASYWGASLNYSTAFYSTQQFGAPVSYNGDAGDFNGTVDATMLEQVATNMGYTSLEQLHQSMQAFSGKSQVAYILILNKPGRSYAYFDNSNDSYDYIERCVLFAKPSYVDNLVYDCPPSTVAHEVLHMFGAEDYYAEGTQRVQRSRLASAYFPNDVMLNSYYDIRYNNVGQYTAYSVGWTDYTPSVCYDNNWWIDS